MSDSRDLSDRIVLVTGGAGGIGRSVALTVGGAGATVALSDLPGERLDAACDELRHAGISALVVPADLTTRAACDAMVATIVAELGGLHGLVACAGVMQTKPLLDLTEAEWRRVIDINLTGTFLCVQAVAEGMASGGSIVLLSSVSGRSGRPMAAHYSASKAGILSLTQSAALALAPRIRVNAICPGVVLTEMWDGILADRAELFGAAAAQEYLDQLRSGAALNRVGEAREVAAVARFLLSDESSFVTGQAINVDGGIEMD